MENFSFCCPTQFEFGRGAETKVGQAMAADGATKVLLHFGGSSAIKSGLLDRVKASLEAAGVSYIECGGVRPNPEVTLVRQAIEICKTEGVDYLLAVGGGSVIDSAKSISLGACVEEDVWEHFYEAPKAPAERTLPIACVLTIPAAGSEAGGASVLSNDEKGKKLSYHSRAVVPRLTFMNPELTFTLPAYQSAAGLTDMYAHLLERFFCPAGSVPVSDNFLMSLMRTVRTVGPRVIESPEDYDARANIMWAGMLCHQGLAGCGRIEDWATHGLEHQLSALDTRVTHGAGLAVMFPAWMRHVYTQDPERFVLYGNQVFGLVSTGDVHADARRAIDATQQFFVSLGMPSCLADFGMDESSIEPLVEKLHGVYGDSFGYFKKLTMDDAREIYRSAL